MVGDGEEKFTDNFIAPEYLCMCTAGGVWIFHCAGIPQDLPEGHRRHQPIQTGQPSVWRRRQGTHVDFLKL